MSEYTAEDYIRFIEAGRRDKISPHALDVIAKKFRELETTSNESTWLEILQPIVPTLTENGPLIKKLNKLYHVPNYKKHDTNTFI